MRKSILLPMSFMIGLVASLAGADEIKVEGGGSTISAVFMPIKTEFEKVSGHKLNIVQTSAVKGLIALSKGGVDVAAGAHPLEDLIAGAEKEGVKIDPSTLIATQVEENRLIAIVNRSNHVSHLSKEQLKGIFTGKILNWKDVGESKLPIVVVWGKETQGQNIQFTRLILDGQPVTQNVKEVKNYKDIQQLVSNTPGAIGIVPVGMSSTKTHTPEIPQIVSPMFVITRGKPEKKVQQVIDFYKSEYGFLKPAE